MKGRDKAFVNLQVSLLSVQKKRKGLVAHGSWWDQKGMKTKSVSR